MSTSSNLIANPAALERVRRFSAPTVSGDYSADCSNGRDLADDLIEQIGEGASPCLLGRVVADLASNGTYGAVHIGFFQRIVERVAL
jgi:hypothetical protein